MTIDFDMLRVLLWLLLIFSVLGFLLSEGLSLGLTMMLFLIGKTTADRQTILAIATPHSLNQLAWLAVSMALLFSAWPAVYAVLFACLPWIMPILVLTYLFRPLGLLFRNANDALRWQQNWDKLLGISGFVVVALLGLIAGNILKGIPFHLDSDVRIFFLGDIWALLNPFSILAAATSLALFTLYGACYLQLKMANPLVHSCYHMVFKSGIAFLCCFGLAGLWLMHLEGYHINSEILPNAASNPLNKFVKRGEGLWLDNYEHVPCLWLLPILAFLSVIAAMVFSKLTRFYAALLASSVAITATVFTFALSLFPFLLPSNRSLNTSLTIWDASASQYTLSILLWVVGLVLPIMALVSRFSMRINLIKK